MWFHMASDILQLKDGYLKRLWSHPTCWRYTNKIIIIIIIIISRVLFGFNF